MQPLICVLLFLAIFAGCQGGRYYMANRLQELGIFSAMALMVLGTWRGFFQLDMASLKDWVLKPVYLILGIMLISSLAFYANFGGNPLYIVSFRLVSSCLLLWAPESISCAEPDCLLMW